METFSHDDFVARAVATFPELADDVAACIGMPTLQVAAFGHRLQRAKGASDWDAYERGIQLVAAVWDHADEQLDRELRWSLVKALDFQGPRGPIAWAYLPREMQLAWARAQKQLEELSALAHSTKKKTH